MVQRVDDAGEVFVHVRGFIIGPLYDFRRAVAQIGCDELGKKSFLIRLVECFEAVCEEAVGGTDEQTVGAAFLHLLAHIQHGTAGRDHVVDDHAVLSFHGIAEELMGNDGILSVHNPGVIPALIEHADIRSEYICKIYGPAHRTLVGTDDHEMLPAEIQVRRTFEKGAEELVSGHEIVETAERDGVPHPGIMGVKGNDLRDAVILELAQSERRIQGFPARALVLPALIEERHDDADAVRLSVGCGNDALQVLKMVVR